MSHDKIKAAARKRMAETGESYAAARREVIREFQAAGNAASTLAGGPERFAISYDGMGPVSRWADTRMGTDAPPTAPARVQPHGPNPTYSLYPPTTNTAGRR